MKRFLIHFLVLTAMGMLSTRLMLFLFPSILSSASLVRISVLLGIYLLFILYLGRLANKANWQGGLRIIVVSILGAVFAWILQLVELGLYYQETGMGGFPDLLEEEFNRSWQWVLPSLVVGEGLYLFMKNRSWLWVLGLVTLIVLPTGYFLQELMEEDAEVVDYPNVAPSQIGKPNIVLILADDLGFGDISAHGNKWVYTPNIDALAKNGIDCIRAYATASVCAPSRAALLTGYYQQRFGFEFLPDPFELLPRTRFSDFESFGHQANFKPWYQPTASLKDRGLDPSVLTLADYLKKEQYATAIIGKWHLGAHPQYDPKYFGFDEFYGIIGAASLYAPVGMEGVVESRHPWDFADFAAWQNCSYMVSENGERKAPDTLEYLTNDLTNRAIDFIERNTSNRFFLHLSYTAPHGPFQALQKHYDKLSHIPDHNKRVYYAMIESMDEGIGKVMAKLQEESLIENTLVIFTSDNGGATYTRASDNTPFLGGKMSNFDGGLIVPLMLQWPRQLPKGMMYTQPVSLLDIVPTVMASIQSAHTPATPFDGVALLPYFSDSTYRDQLPHTQLFWRTGYVKTIQEDGFKLHINEKDELQTLHYLPEDPDEQHNLITSQQVIANRLRANWEEWQRSLPPPKWETNADVAIPVDTTVSTKYYFFPW